MSKISRPFGLACLVAANLLIFHSAVQASPAPSVRVTSVIGQGVVRLSAKASGPFAYVVHHPSTDLYYIDLTGVSAGNADAAKVIGNDIVRSYRLEQYQSGEETVSRIELLLGNGATPKITREGSDALRITVSKKDVMSADFEESAQPRMLNVALRKPSAASVIRHISVAKNGEVPEVLVLGSGAMNYHELRLSNPVRLVLDFPSERIAAAAKKTSSDVEPIRDVRAAQFSPEVARVVIDLSTDASYSVKHVDGGVAVEFASSETNNSPAQPASSSAHSSSTQSAAQGDSDSTQAQAAAQPSTPSAPSDKTADAPVSNSSKTTAAVSSSPSQPAVQSAGFDANAPAQSASSAVPQAQDPKPVNPPASQSPAQPSAPVQPGPVANDNSSAPAQNPQAAQSAQQQAAQAAAQSAPPAQTAPAGSVMPSPAPALSPVSVISQDQSGAKYTGAPISVNLKNVDLQDFFRLIHEISGLNVVVDPNVKGTLTLVLDNVPWDQALEIVLKNNDLDKQLDGNVLRIATKATMKKEADEARDLAKAQIEAADLVTTTRTLSYAKAGDMVDTLKKFLSPRGDVLADNRTNTLIISDIPTVMPVVDNLIRELDVKTQQVEIEARVVAANRSFARELGSQFAFAGSATNGRNLFSGTQQVGTSPISRNTALLPTPPVIVGSGGTGASMPLVTNLGASVPTSGVAYAFSSANFALDYIITAAESKGVGKLLSKPKEIVQNNQQATIKQGTKIPVQTIINNTISVQFIDAVLELQVTPQITKDGTIFLNVHVENTQIDPAIPRIQGIPALDTQAQDTHVLVADGQTVMTGGIIISNQQTTINDVPFVGSLPIIGQLFRHTTISTNSQELLFFITPRILPM